MKPEIKLHGIVKRSKKVYYNPDLYVKVLQELEGKEFEEIVKEKQEKPSKNTHGFYRGGIIASCLTTEKFAGWDKDEIDDFFCNMFLSEKIEKVFGTTRTEITRIGSTGDLNQKEMNEFIEKVIHWLSEEGIEILSPEQYNLSKYRIIK